MKKVVTALVLVCFTAVGCTGSFQLTKKVYNWHRSQPDKWSDEFGFLVCALLPIYGISTFADAIVFNSIEFWTGKNPVNEAKAETTNKFVKTKDGEATLSYNAQEQKMTIASTMAAGKSSTVTLEKGDNMVIAKDENGKILYTTVMGPNGDYQVYDENHNLVKSYSAEGISLLESKYVR